MTVTDYTLPSTAETIDRNNKILWTNPNNIKTDDADYSNCDVNKNDYSDWLRATNFSFSIPDDATINGIEIAIKHDSVSDSTYDSAIYLRKTSGQVGSNYAIGTSWGVNTPETITYGGATDLWGTTWSAADINSSNFGIDNSTFIYGDKTSIDAKIFFIKIRIYYTAAPPSGTNTQINIGDTWKAITAMKVNIGDTWKEVAGVQVNIGDTWKTVF